MLYSDFLIKPASSRCNLDCEYCFYKDEARHRKIADYGLMSREVLESVVKRAYAETEQAVTFGFQGGEPLLSGISFYETFFALVEKYNVNKIETRVTVQTNGLLINDEFAKLFKAHDVLVGISLDGFAQVHDRFRYGYHKEPSFEKVMAAIEILKQHEVDFNILTVVNKYVARNIKDIYAFFKAQGFQYLQFIEALDFNLQQSGKERFSLNNKDYAKFLNDLFTLWYEDLNNGNYVSIRFFDNVIFKIFRNEAALPCFYRGSCQNQNVVETNGDLFSCDFYVLDDYKLGNISDGSVTDMMTSQKAQSFVKESMMLPSECNECKYQYFCRNGCRRYRVNGKYYYCEAVYKFYDEFLSKFMNAADKIRQREKSDK